MQRQIADASQRGLFPEVRVFRPLAEYNETPYAPSPYDASKIVTDQHHFPRFGHTNDIAALASGSDAATDYVVGIVTGALLVLAVALVWALVLVGLKAAGHRRVGCLAGRLEGPDAGAGGAAPREAGKFPLLEEEPEDDADAGRPLLMSEHVDGRHEAAQKFKRTVLATRAVFVLSGLAVIVSSILFFTNGVKAFQESLNNVQGGLELVQKTALDAVAITDEFVNVKDRLLDVFQQTQQETGGKFCNGDSFIATQIRNEIGAVSSELETLSAMIDDTVASFGDDLQQVVSLVDGVNDQLGSTDAFLYVAVAVIALLNAIILAMLVVAYFSARGVSNGCTKFTTHAILWPVFVFFLLSAWLFSLLFLVASLAGSDFCVDPDEIVDDFLRQHQDQFHSAIFGLIIYYTSGCQVTPAGDGHLVAIAQEIQNVVGKANEFSESIMGIPLPGLKTECGLDKAAAAALLGGAELINETTLLLNGAFIGVRRILECKTFNSIYTMFVHEAFCVEGVNGLAWIFSTSFAMFLFAMVMLMFRAGLYPVKHPAAPAN